MVVIWMGSISYRLMCLNTEFPAAVIWASFRIFMRRNLAGRRGLVTGFEDLQPGPAFCSLCPESDAMWSSCLPASLWLCLPHHDRNYPSDCNVCRTFLSYSALLSGCLITATGKWQLVHVTTVRMETWGVFTLLLHWVYLWKGRVRQSKIWEPCPHHAI